jgi:hypothetical protein
MPEVVTTERAQGRAILRKLKNPVYDTAIFPAAATVRMGFFQAPIGFPIAAAGAIKTIADTNLTQAGCLGKPMELDWFNTTLEVGYQASILVDTALSVDIALLYWRGLFEIKFGNQKPWLQCPVHNVAPGVAVTGVVETKNDGAGHEYQYIANGVASTKNFTDVTIGDQSIPIGSAETFTAEITFPAAVTPTTARRIRCYLNGIYYTGL